ncbi:hypothetical protein B0T24DRAFT_706708 [Lasiosphaeria ovina]|uniref:Uncharacterized protein n=1 Tax=Lasiosphaeria ovina TaxID=92902 RepID=A0AAE0N5P8_9PEZI|nr:hypothetical protein B0T24DRAFT_706708 [Lasiosphaeria ovina]
MASTERDDSGPVAGCSAANPSGDGPRNWVLTDSMMAAYVAMRGGASGVDLENERLLGRLLNREEQNEASGEARILAKVKTTNFEHLCVPGGHGADKITAESGEGWRAANHKGKEVADEDHQRDNMPALPDSIPGTPTPESIAVALAAVFEGGQGSLLNAQSSMDWSAAAGGYDDDDDDDDDDEDWVSDDEGPAEYGRISPCTFAAWAEGCSSSKQQQQESPKKPTVPKDEPRQRPPTPADTGDEQNEHVVQYGAGDWPIYDDYAAWSNHSDGNPAMAPQQHQHGLPPNPTVLWTAPGIDPSHNLGRADGKRMLRDGFIKVLPADPEKIKGDVETYTEEQVAAAVENYEGELFGGVRGVDARAALTDGYRERRMLAGERKRLDEENDEMRKQLKALHCRKIEARNAAALMARIAQRDAAQHAARMREHAAAHLAAVAGDVADELAGVEAAEAEQTGLRARLAAAEAELQAMAAAAGYHAGVGALLEAAGNVTEDEYLALAEPLRR